MDDMQEEGVENEAWNKPWHYKQGDIVHNQRKRQVTQTAARGLA